MNLKYVFSVIKRPEQIYKYTVRAISQQYRYIVFSLKRKAGIDSHSSLIKKANRYCSCRNDRELEEKVKGRTFNIFLCEGFDETIREIKSDDAYFHAIIAQADKVMNNCFYILYRYVENMYEKETGHYKWDIDYAINYRFCSTYFLKVRQANHFPGADIKHIWEIARMQYLFAPALAYRLTGEEKYAEKVKDILLDFIHCNPADVGADWNISMEVGIRISNMLLAFELIRISPCVDANFIRIMIASAIEHQNHILQNQENTAQKNSNHYLGGLLGLAAVSVFCPGGSKSNKVFKYVCGAIEHEIDSQIHPDGGDYEGSSSYQRLVGELLLFTLVLCQRKGYCIHPETIKRIEAMEEYSLALSDAAGNVSQIGDNDSGRVFQLLPEPNRSYLFFFGLLSAFLHKASIADYKNGLECFFSLKKTVPFRHLDRNQLFPDIKTAVAFMNGSQLIVTANETQLYGGAGGHTHNDLLSFILKIDGQEIITDPGTGTYSGDAKKRRHFRLTSSHATVAVNAAEQRLSFDKSVFAWASKAHPELSMEEDEKEIIINGKHDGYLTRYNCIHHRKFVLSKQEPFLSVYDTLSGDAAGDISIPLGENVRCEQINATSFILKAGNITVHLNSTIPLFINQTLYSKEYDQTSSSIALSGHFSQPETNLITFKWGLIIPESVNLEL